MAGPLVLRIDVAPSIGLGHLRRATALASAARATGVETVFASPRDGSRLLVDDGIAPGRLIEPARIPQVAGRQGVVIVDTLWSGNADATAAEVERLVEAGLRVIVIDSLPPDHYDVPAGGRGADLVVTPYLTAERFRPAPAAGRWLVGPRYCILDPAFALARERLAPTAPDRMLFACGGSDPEGLAASFLDRLAVDGRPVDVVVGPLVSPLLRSRIVELAASFDRVRLLRSPANLAAAIAAAGFVAGRVGLLRYEAAALGRGGLYIHFGGAYRAYLEAFSRSDVAKIRFADDLNDANAFLEEAARIANGEAAFAFNRAAFETVDGRGAQRLIAEIFGHRDP